MITLCLSAVIIKQIKRAKVNRKFMQNKMMVKQDP